MSDDPRLRGMEVRYGGRTLRLEIFINTDEAPEAVAERLAPAARGPRRDMAVTAISEVPVAEAMVFWSKMIAAAHEHVGGKKP